MCGEYSGSLPKFQELPGTLKSLGHRSKRLQSSRTLNAGQSGLKSAAGSNHALREFVDIGTESPLKF